MVKIGFTYFCCFLLCLHSHATGFNSNSRPVSHQDFQSNLVAFIANQKKPTLEELIYFLSLSLSPDEISKITKTLKAQNIPLHTRVPQIRHFANRIDVGDFKIQLNGQKNQFVVGGKTLKITATTQVSDVLLEILSAWKAPKSSALEKLIFQEAFAQVVSGQRPPFSDLTKDVATKTIGGAALGAAALTGALVITVGAASILAAPLALMAVTGGFIGGVAAGVWSYKKYTELQINLQCEGNSLFIRQGDRSARHVFKNNQLFSAGTTSTLKDGALSSMTSLDQNSVEMMEAIYYKACVLKQVKSMNRDLARAHAAMVAESKRTQPAPVTAQGSNQ